MVEQLCVCDLVEFLVLRSCLHFLKRCCRMLTWPLFLNQFWCLLCSCYQVNRKVCVAAHNVLFICVGILTLRLTLLDYSENLNRSSVSRFIYTYCADLHSHSTALFSTLLLTRSTAFRDKIIDQSSLSLIFCSSVSNVLQHWRYSDYDEVKHLEPDHMSGCDW